MGQSKISKSNKDTIPFVDNAYQLRDLSGNRAVLIGNATHISMREANLGNFISLKPRSSVSAMQGLWEKNPPKVYFSINQDIVHAGAKKFVFAFANDAYLHWGYASKGSTLLLGGSCGEASTYLQIFHFESGKLVSTEERTIPGYTDLRQYSDTAGTIIDQYRHNFPSIKVFYSAPLRKFADDLTHIEYVDEAIFKSLKYRTLDFSEKKRSSGNFIPVALCVLGVLSYVGLLGKGWFDYQNATGGFDVAMKDPIVDEAGGIDPNVIDVIQQQRFFMQEAKTQVDLSRKTRLLVNAIARIGEVQIKSMSVYIPPSKTDAKVLDRPDIRIIIIVPHSGKAALDQGKEILDVISSNSGLTLHMARQGFKDIEKRREFTLEGFFYG